MWQMRLASNAVTQVGIPNIQLFPVDGPPGVCRSYSWVNFSWPYATRFVQIAKSTMSLVFKLHWDSPYPRAL